MRISMTLRFKNYRVKTNQLVCSKIFKSTTGMSPELMNDIFHYVERSTAQIVFLSPLPNYKKILRLLRSSKPKLMTGEPTTVLAEYVRNVCFHRLCTFTVLPSFCLTICICIFLLDHISQLYIIQWYFFHELNQVVFYSIIWKLLDLHIHMQTFQLIVGTGEISWKHFFCF